MARAAAPFLHAKLAAIEHSIPQDNPNTTNILVEFVHPKPQPD